MADFIFADRYAEAGLAPTAQMITSRQTAAERIVAKSTNAQILDLAGIYFGSSGLDLVWLRDEFATDDPTFSLVNNERETRVLAAATLGALVAAGRSEAILAIAVGGVAGHRPPIQADWLLQDATEAIGRLAVADRKPVAIDTKVVPAVNPKLTDEIAELAAGDWPSLLTALGKIRTESASSAKTTAGQTATALTALNRQVRLQREEGQMLWWLVGGHSRCLGRPFSTLAPQQAAIVGAVDLGGLTSFTRLGPVAAPALLERVVALAKRPKTPVSQDLASAIDGVGHADLNRLPIFEDTVPPRLAPVTASIALAKSMGPGAWHARFRETTGLDATIVLEPTDLAVQLYREHLLGQLL